MFIETLYNDSDDDDDDDDVNEDRCCSCCTRNEPVSSDVNSDARVETRDQPKEHSLL